MKGLIRTVVTKKNGNRVQQAANTTRIFPNIIAALGNTPIVQFSAVTRGIRTPVAAKIESTTPAARSKTASASA